MKEIVEKVIDAFSQVDNTIPVNSRWLLDRAIVLLKNINSLNLSEDEFKKQADIIIVGTIICALSAADSHLGLTQQNDYKYLYPLSYQELLQFFTVQHNKMRFDKVLEIMIKNVGERALIIKDIPFTGVINYQLTPLLVNAGINPDHFNDYKLHTDPATMDTSMRSEPERKKILEKLSILDRKKILQKPYLESQEYRDRKLKLETMVFEQEQSHLKRKSDFKLWSVLAVLVGVIFFPSLLFTLPWLRREEQKINDEYTNADISRLTFTENEYKEVLDLRASVKMKHPNLRPADTHDLKPKKIMEQSSGNVVMYCDKAQAKRWDPRFLAQADSPTFEREYSQSINESSELGLKIGVRS